MQALPGYEATILASKENKASGDFTRLPRPAHRCAAELLNRRRGHRCWDQRCPNCSPLVCIQQTKKDIALHTWPRAYGVDPNSLAALLIRQASSECNQRAFG